TAITRRENPATKLCSFGVSAHFSPLHTFRQLIDMHAGGMADDGLISDITEGTLDEIGQRNSHFPSASRSPIQRGATRSFANGAIPPNCFQKGRNNIAKILSRVFANELFSILYCLQIGRSRCHRYHVSLLGYTNVRGSP